MSKKKNRARDRALEEQRRREEELRLREEAMAANRKKGFMMMAVMIVAAALLAMVMSFGPLFLNNSNADSVAGADSQMADVSGSADTQASEAGSAQ